MRTVARGRITGIGRAAVVVVAVPGRPRADPVLTCVVDGAGVVVVAGQGIGGVYATRGKNRNTGIGGAGIVVVADNRGMDASACCRIAGISGAEIVVITPYSGVGAEISGSTR